MIGPYKNRSVITGPKDGFPGPGQRGEICILTSDRHKNPNMHLRGAKVNAVVLYFFVETGQNVVFRTAWVLVDPGAG